MAAPIGPGDWVECVDVSPRYQPGYGWCPAPDQLVLRSIYRVARVFCEPVWGVDSVVLEGLGAHETRADGAYWAGRFRPIYRPKSELIDTLKQPAPAGVRELEDV
jgi:hypothetical protein